MSRRLIVTGGAGFIGSNFVRYWNNKYPEDQILIIDALTYAGNLKNLNDIIPPMELGRGRKFPPHLLHSPDKPVIFHWKALKDVKPILTKHPEYFKDAWVINFAAETHNSRSINDPSAFYDTNVQQLQTFINWCLRGKVARFHHVSTDEVFGDLPLYPEYDGPGFTEESPYRPNSPYAASKAASDHVIRAAWKTWGLPITISNACNNFGPYQHPEKVIPKFTIAALRGEKLPLYKSSQNSREWIHVEDHCRGIERVLLHGRIGETYNLGSGYELTVEELADLILDTLKCSKDLKEYVPDRPSHDRRYLLDSTKASREIGYNPKPLSTGALMRTVRWYQDNPQWWEPLLKNDVDERQWG